MSRAGNPSYSAVTTSSSALPSGAATEATLSAINAKVPSLGQALAASSVPVVLTAAQLATLTPPAAITGYATETTLGTRLSESDFDTKVGSLTETAPSTDTASSGLNGRLQRIAQRITSLIALLPAALTGSGNFKVSLQESNATQAVSGTVTANAGTNLNTSALALDSTVAKDASLTTLNTSVNTLLKPANTLTAVTTVATVTSLTQMNGQAIAMGTGARTAGTQRVTVATDDLVPVSAASLPLPSGAATSALQTTGNTSLSSIDTKTYATPTALFAGQKTVAVTNTALAIASSQAVNGVIIQALSANANSVYVGPSTVTTANGFELQPGQATSVAITNLSTVFINGTSGDGICYVGS